MSFRTCFGISNKTHYFIAQIVTLEMLKQVQHDIGTFVKLHSYGALAKIRSSE